MRSCHQAACASGRLYAFHSSTCSGRISLQGYQGPTRNKSTERTKCALALSGNGYRGSVLAAGDRNNAIAAIFRADGHRLLNALARPGCFDRDCDRHSNRLGNARLRRVYATIAIAGVPPFIVLPPDLTVVHRVPPVVMNVLQVVAVAAKFERVSALPASGPGDGTAGLGKKRNRNSGQHK